MSKVMVWAMAMAAVLWAAPVQSQQKKEEDPFAKLLFAPDLVLKHASDIGLKPEQRRAILSVIKDIQGELSTLQLEMAEPALAISSRKSVADRHSPALISIGEDRGRVWRDVNTIRVRAAAPTSAAPRRRRPHGTRNTGCRRTPARTRSKPGIQARS